LSPHYVPPTLPHRELQIETLLGNFAAALAQPSKSPLRIVQIVGRVGTGKTSTAIRFGDRLAAEGRKRGVEVVPVYMNLKLHGGSRVILYRYLVQQSVPALYSTSLGADELLLQLARYLKDQHKFLLITLDEIDYFLRHAREPRVVYDLTRFDELTRPGDPCGILGILFIARTKEYYVLLDPPEVSTLGRVALEFTPYSSEQLVAILEQRATEALAPGAVAKDTLRLISDATAAAAGGSDVRYALDLLLFASELAEREGASRVVPDHVRKIISETYPGITSEDVLNLPEAGRLALLAIARALKAKKTAYVGLRDIRASWAVLAEEQKVKPADDLEEQVQDLHDRGIAEVRSLTEIGISGVPTDVLDRFLDGLLRRLKSSFG